jgi:hypothetical protein
MVGRRAEAGGHEQSADLVAVQADGVRLEVDPWAADMNRRRGDDHPFLLGVTVEAGHRAEPPGARGRRVRP